jgi:hypothetical protein
MTLVIRYLPREKGKVHRFFCEITKTSVHSYVVGEKTPLSSQILFAKLKGD